MVKQTEPFTTRTTSLSVLKMATLPMAHNPWYANQTNQNGDFSWSVKLRVSLKTKTILELWQWNMSKTVIALTLTGFNSWL
jgi:hypothetical protein